MLRTRLGPALHSVVFSLLVLLPLEGGSYGMAALPLLAPEGGPAAARTRAQDESAAGTLSEMPLAGGLRAALAAIDDRAAPDRSQFLLEFIRRTYGPPASGKSEPQGAARLLLAHLDASRAGNAGGSETLPLPLSPAFWTGQVFQGRVTAPELVSAIVRSRDASLLYYGLMALDDPTRAWLAGQPSLVAEIVSRRAAVFALAAPGLRVRRGTVTVPGGELAEPVWQALLGRRATDPADFARALLESGDGRLAYFFRAMADLTPGQQRLALSLESPSVEVRISAARRLLAMFERGALGWRVDDRAFSRPSRDPAVLLGELPVDAAGRPVLPGTRAFWVTVFAGSDSIAGGKEAGRLADGEPVDFAWLCEQIFAREPPELGTRYGAVLFASRNLQPITPATWRDGVDAVRAAGAYPAVVGALERAGSRDLATFAAAGRRAARLSAIGDEARALRSLVQFQGALALVTRAAARGSIPSGSLSQVVTSLCAIDVGEKGDYDGALARWLGAWAATQAGERAAQSPPAALWRAGRTGPANGAAAEGPEDLIDRTVLALLAGPPLAEPRFVEWEGTRYRLDFAGAEAARIESLLGDRPRRDLSQAVALVSIADDLATTPAAAALDAAAGRAEEVAKALAPGSEPAMRRSLDEIPSTLRRAARRGDPGAARHVRPLLQLLADDMLARGLLELTYAAALAQPEGGPVSASDLARRHDFGFGPTGGGRAVAWHRPLPDAKNNRGWHISGSLLDLDVALAERTLRRVSVKSLARRPSVSSEDRRTFIETVPLMEPSALTDADRDTIAAAIKQGRARMAAIRTPADADKIAAEIRLGPIARTLLPWVAAHDPARLRVFLSPAELLWLGLDKTPLERRLDAWGAQADPRLGCLCLQLLDRRSWESLAGHWNGGLLASTFPDLNLRLAELLAELRMPAALAAPVLAAATFDLVNTAVSRDQDDRRGLVEFVQALRIERVEEYLAMLTTDGPLVPVGDAPEPSPSSTGRGAPR